jgi:hypothetical protein
MTAYGMDEEVHVFFTSALDGGEWSASHPRRFNPKEIAPGTHWVGDLVGHRAVCRTWRRESFLTLQGLNSGP